MGPVAWTWVLVAASFALYALAGLWGRARTTSAYYVAEKQVSPLLNGMATGADWMSAASFISMAGVVALLGRDGSIFLMGWTGGYVLLAVLLAPYLRKYGKYTVPQFVGERYYSRSARGVAVVCAVFVSFTYVAGQMRGVGVVFARFLDVPVERGVLLGMAIVLFYAVLGGMKGVTYAQVAQYVVLIAAYLVPAIYVSIMLTGNPVPQLGLGGRVSAEGARILGVEPGVHLLQALDRIGEDLGFGRYTAGTRPRIDVLFSTLALMIGTAGLPHIIIRFFTVPKVRDARASAAWALLFIALLYTTAPAVAAFARAGAIQSLNGKRHADAPAWVADWERTGLVRFTDRDGDGVMRLSGDPARNEVRIDPDVLVLANPEIAGLPPWVVGLVAAGALAAALSTAAGLLLVISAAVAHDLVKGMWIPRVSERGELAWARGAATVAVLVAGWLGVHPPGFVSEVVALAFGLAASSFFPVLVAGIFWRRATREGAIAGMLSGLAVTTAYVHWFKFWHPELDVPAHWWLGISPQGFGTVGMLVNLTVLVAVSLRTPAPPQAVQDLVTNLRYPREPVRPAPAPTALRAGERR
ncbi:sodium:solute symporter family protein [Anaeromyxobacter dehalogenans]|uniref:SSS sodium solute transporter superfamily n=1 Tax=Anaeromyxobacter dehalogenans (strain 2CP-C) TaxID=290397 RepID=Q2IFV4_ANADE|nr:sodium:solute symporter family protein [Anaeromyxobacter dehalogenans]ABC83462.1 SSS sodium solute transporter superfamily [Anaeromyxobacter dehalogenans 2CP-C]